MSQIFVSYSRNDQPFARQLYRELESLDYCVWLDMFDIHPGQHWDRSIDQALHESHLLLLVHTTASYGSDNVWDEWGFFRNRNKPIIPLIVEDIELPYRLERLQYIDFMTQSFDQAIKQLHEAISQYDFDPMPDGPGGSIPHRVDLPKVRRKAIKRQSILMNRGKHFKLDIERILHSEALRRLADVTQVVDPAEGHVFHNRLTHTLKVAQIARRIAEKLIDDPASKAIADDLGGLDAEVVEAAALAHDLGHPPFGHIAAIELDKLVRRAGLQNGYEGNPQAFRILTPLEQRHMQIVRGCGDDSVYATTGDKDTPPGTPTPTPITTCIVFLCYTREEGQGLVEYDFTTANYRKKAGMSDRYDAGGYLTSTANTFRRSPLGTAPSCSIIITALTEQIAGSAGEILNEANGLTPIEHLSKQRIRSYLED